MKKLILTAIALCIPLLIISCSETPSGKEYPRFDAGDTDLLDFRFAAKNNSVLPADAIGTLDGDTISITVPHDASLDGLVAEYVTNSPVVQVNGITQASGKSANDFDSPVVYHVSAKNLAAREYTVTVTKAPSTEKKITTFALLGTDAIIDETGADIRVSLPPKTSLKKLPASFSAACSQVTVDGVVQASGVTLNDFSVPVVYTAVAENGSRKDYTVTATVIPAPWKEITSFVFRSSDNPALGSDVPGTIADDIISVVLPFKSKANDLAAWFVTTGEKVSLDGVAQSAGSTRNDFSSVRDFVVTAEDGGQRTYTVDVTVAKSDAKAITRFVLDGEECAIDEDARAIRVAFPASRPLGALKAFFVTTGVLVSVGGAEQESGRTENNFTNPVAYIVKADNGSTRTYTVIVTPTAELAGLWNFEYTDAAGYTLFGATQTPGVQGNSLRFDGYDDYVLVPDSADLTLPQAGSVETLVKIITHKPYAGIVHKGVRPDFSDETYSLQFWGTDGTVRFLVTGASGRYSYVDSSTKLSTDVWYHIVATWNASEVRLYINGKLESWTPNTVGEVRDSAGGLVIGAQLADTLYNSSWRNLGMNGIVDRVELFGRALPDTEVAARYETIKTAGGEALAAYLMHVASRHSGLMIALLGGIAFILAGLFVFNRRRMRAGG